MGGGLGIRVSAVPIEIQVYPLLPHDYPQDMQRTNPPPPPPNQAARRGPLIQYISTPIHVVTPTACIIRGNNPLPITYQHVGSPLSITQHGLLINHYPNHRGANRVPFALKSINRSIVAALVTATSRKELPCDHDFVVVKVRRPR